MSMNNMDWGKLWEKISNIWILQRHTTISLWAFQKSCIQDISILTSCAFSSSTYDHSCCRFILQLPVWLPHTPLPQSKHQKLDLPPPFPLHPLCFRNCSGIWISFYWPETQFWLSQPLAERRIEIDVGVRESERERERVRERKWVKYWKKTIDRVWGREGG